MSQQRFCSACGHEAAGTFCASCGAALGPVGNAEDTWVFPPVPAESATAVEPVRSRRAAVIAGFATLLVLTAAVAAGAVVLLGRRPPHHPVVAAAVTIADSPSPSPSPSPTGFADFAALYRAKSGAIVRLETVSCDYTGVGTGFFIDAHHIATVGHVVADATSVDAIVGGRHVQARVVGLDRPQDVALLVTHTAWDGPTIPLTEQGASVGDSVAALGFPEGLDLTLTKGSVSAVDRVLNQGFIHQVGLIQTDTSVNPGNSGGPLMTLDGSAVGLVDSAMIGANNINYAVGGGTALADYAGWPDDGAVPPTDCGYYFNTPYDPGAYPDAVPGDTTTPADEPPADILVEPTQPPAEAPVPAPPPADAPSGEVGDGSPVDPETDPPADNPPSDSPPPDATP